MGDEARAGRLRHAPLGAEQGASPMAELFDTPAFERRLELARIRRAISLGNRAAEGTPAGDGARVLVGGVVTHRQRPATAGGTTFLNLEDETGLVNVIVSKGCWVHHRRLVQTAPALLVRGRLETAEGVTNLIAETMSLLPLVGSLRSRDFR